MINKTIALLLLIFATFITLLDWLQVSLTIEVASSQQADVYEVFYDIGGGFRSNYSRRATLPKNGGTLSFNLPKRGLVNLRIDPGRQAGDVFIKSLTLKQQLFSYSSQTQWTAKELVRDFEPLHQITVFSEENHLLHLHSSGEDPYFISRLDFQTIYPFPFLRNLAILSLILAIGLIFTKYLVKSHQTAFLPHPLVQYAFVGAFVLIIVMAVTSAYNKHPDEHHHFVAAQYYLTHWLPPKIGTANHTYSMYGTSYLNYYWIEYLLAGKLASLLLTLVNHPLIAVRGFNIFLFGSLIVIFFRRGREQLIILSSMLVTPQVWYIFSYVNNDAFPLFLSLLAVSEITYQESPLNKFLNSPSRWAGGLLFGILLGLLAVGKQNYYIFLLFIGGWMVLESVKKFDYSRLQKYALIILVAAAVLTVRYLVDIAVNGESNFAPKYIISLFSNSATSKLLAHQEKMAHKEFKPSAQNSYFALHLRAKGVSYPDLFLKWRWHDISFASFVGYYGYMSIRSPDWYYFGMKVLYAAFLAFLIGSVLFGLNKQNIFLLGIVLLAMLGTLLISSYHSWNNDFQAQGRYLFPIISFLGYLMYQNRLSLSNLLTHLFILSLFLMSTYSFIVVALTRINT